MSLTGPHCIPAGTGAHCLDAERWENGLPRQCIPDGECYVRTRLGTLRPRHEAEYPRRPEIDRVAFHESGEVTRISLTQTPVETPIGLLPAELLLFHENGNLRRLFPQDGTLDGFWEESQEYALAPVLDIPTPVGTLKARYIAVAFYPDGTLFSLTLWPNEAVHVDTPLGRLAVRTGISFHPGGAVQSVEPKAPTPVETPIGTVTAFDPEPLGVSGDRNSLVFDAEGRLVSVVTSVESFVCRSDDGEVVRFAPDVAYPNSAEAMVSTHSIRLTFLGRRIRVEKGLAGSEYAIERVSIDRPAHALRRHLPVMRS